MAETSHRTAPYEMRTEKTLFTRSGKEGRLLREGGVAEILVASAV